MFNITPSSNITAFDDMFEYSGNNDNSSIDFNEIDLNFRDIKTKKKYIKLSQCNKKIINLFKAKLNNFDFCYC